LIEISQLGIIGNCRSAALVSREGEIVWCCLPDFDSPSIFAKILDEGKGGSLGVQAEATTIDQSYIDRTNILRTVYTGVSFSFEIIDFMPIYQIEGNFHNQAPEIYRLFHVISGKPEIKIRYQPKLNYAKVPTRSSIFPQYIKTVTARGDYHSVYFYSNLPYQSILEEKPILLEGDAFLLVSYHQKLNIVDIRSVILELERTKVYWLNWVSRTQTYPSFQENIIRSALVLKLLTYRKTGAVIAAVTTSLPENLSETRNWDYRYCWLRDASMIIQTLREIRHKNTAREFLRFLLNTIIHKADTLQVLYGIRGEKELPEKKLYHLKGYKKSRPVRIGNAAYRQKQNDVYGILMDLIHASFLHFPTALHESEELWTTVRFIMKTIEDNWQKPDRSIWEIRNERKHFVFSKVLSWVAADRGVALAQLLERKEFISPWTEIREAIRTEIEAKGFHTGRQAYTQSFGSSDLDASLLLMERVGYCQANDPRYISTVRAIYKDLCHNGLMYRYKNRDDFGTPRSAFTICTFWMIDSLYKIGERETAVTMFENLLARANPLGLFSEDLDFETSELLGNFPQGYSHLALINSAILLNGNQAENPFRYISP
jgi:GH15 family glucan-1,4-alpha-glucosidase